MKKKKIESKSVQRRIKIQKEAELDEFLEGEELNDEFVEKFIKLAKELGMLHETND